MDTILRERLLKTYETDTDLYDARIFDLYVEKYRDGVINGDFFVENIPDPIFFELLEELTVES